ncbi:MAG: sigma 54-interacting transcriptional regulator [Acidobacteriota bacterium]
MTWLPADRRLIHPSVEGFGGHPPLVQVRLTDQQRLAVVLQGAALRAHLDHGGWRLGGEGWDDAELTASGVLKLPPPLPGRCGSMPQVDALRLLRRVFRTPDDVFGRGQARRVARELTVLWRQELTPFGADLLVEQILEAAPFLWGGSYDAARGALAAEHLIDGASHLWIAGPGRARRSFLRLAGSYEDLLAQVGGSEARELWDAVDGGGDPREHFQSGHWKRAVALWRRKARRTREDSLSYARCLFNLGRYAEAAQTLLRREEVEARLLRLRCLLELDERNAALRAVNTLEQQELTPKQEVDLGEVAVRLLAGKGDRDGIRRWVARMLAISGQGDVALEALLVAAGAASDLGDTAALDRYLEGARGALEIPALAVRWHQLDGLSCYAREDGPGASAALGRALKLCRRKLRRGRAGRLWNDLAMARVLADDLPGAERACRHALRLLVHCDGPLYSTLSLYNLAEVRVRRGRLDGAAETIERSMRENRRSGNQRGLLQDQELWIRLELARGRVEAALSHYAEVQQMGLVDTALGDVFEALAARARGWLGQSEAAAGHLGQSGDVSLAHLEPEERPAVWALAGNSDEAWRIAAGTPWETLWGPLVVGERPDARAWRSLDLLEDYRAARLVYDIEQLMPGASPPLRLRNAIMAFRRAGAESFAERLESRSLSVWKALRSYLEQPPGSLKGAEQMLVSMGYGDVRLTWRRGGGGETAAAEGEDRGPEHVLVGGPGGEETLTAPAAGGTLGLRTTHVDGVLRAVFSLLVRDAEGLVATVEDAGEVDEGAEAPVVRGRIVGRSPALLGALRDLDRFAEADQLPVLILGESGTGKELFAQRVHDLSPRSGRPFLAVNCGQFSRETIQSELFGHERGAFTGAQTHRQGIFEAAAGGTVFLDEIGELPMEVQPQLLRVLQDGEVRRLGSDRGRRVSFRVVAATHRDLESMVGEGTFREDLYYRLKYAQVRLPPLRDRGDDVNLLAGHLLAQVAPRVRLTQDARRRIASYPWPGNVRELKGVLEASALLADGDRLDAGGLRLPEGQEEQVPAAVEPEADVDYHRAVEDFRRAMVGAALKRSGGNRAAAARSLGLSRQALTYIAQQLGLV